MSNVNNTNKPQEDNDVFDNIVYLNNPQGEEEKFEFLDLVEYQGEEYVVLLPCDENESAGEVVILMLEETTDDIESYVSVDSEDVLCSVFNIFREKFKDTFNFVD